MHIFELDDTSELDSARTSVSAKRRFVSIVGSESIMAACSRDTSIKDLIVTAELLQLVYIYADSMEIDGSQCSISKNQGLFWISQ